MLRIAANDAPVSRSAASELAQSRPLENTMRAPATTRRRWLVLVFAALGAGCSLGETRGDRERSHAGRM